MPLVKNSTEIRSLKEAGRITRDVLHALDEALQPGVSTIELELLANQMLSRNRSTAPFKNYEGFGHALCVSLNAEIVNGPPSRERFLQAGDIVSIATAAEHRGMHAKAARSWHVGTSPTEDISRLLSGTAQVIEAALQASGKVKSLNELLAVVPETASQYKLTVLRDLGGAGIGKKLHDYPPVPNHPKALEETILLQPGLAFTLMPMFSLGASDNFSPHADGWTYVSEDGALTAHFADTLLMTEAGLVNITGPAYS